MGLRVGKWKAKKVTWGGEGRVQKSCKSEFWDCFFIIRYGKPPFGYMKGSFGGAAIVLRVVENAVSDAVGADDVGGKVVAVRGE